MLSQPRRLVRFQPGPQSNLGAREQGAGNGELGGRFLWAYAHHATERPPSNRLRGGPLTKPPALPGVSDFVTADADILAGVFSPQGEFQQVCNSYGEQAIIGPGVNQSQYVHKTIPMPHTEANPGAKHTAPPRVSRTW
jgi:hypothetical protein